MRGHLESKYLKMWRAPFESYNRNNLCCFYFLKILCMERFLIFVVGAWFYFPGFRFKVLALKVARSSRIKISKDLEGAVLIVQ